MNKCAKDACNGTATKNSALCLSCENRRAMNIAVVFGLLVPRPVMTPAQMHETLMGRVREGQS